MNYVEQKRELIDMILKKKDEIKTLKSNFERFIIEEREIEPLLRLLGKLTLMEIEEQIEHNNNRR